MTLVAINGVGGRMGQTLREAIGESDDLRLGVAIEHPNSPLIGEEVDGVYVVGDINAALEDFDVIVDFSIPPNDTYTVTAVVPSQSPRMFRAAMRPTRAPAAGAQYSTVWMRGRPLGK